MKTAIITGISGQDGSYLAELLLSKGYHVTGLKRRASTENHERIEHLFKCEHFSLVESELTDFSCVSRSLMDIQPDEYYNLAAQSHVATSFKQPEYTWKVDAEAVQIALEAIRLFSPNTRFYQASTSEMFGSQIDSDGFQRETTQLSPNSPYGIAKVAAHHNVRLYREAYNIHASSGILFNHESPRRGELFVTRKICKWIGSYANGLLERNAKLHLGNLDAKRDWGYASDYVYGMWLMLQQDYPDDYVLATGETYSIREFLEEAFKIAGLENWEKLVAINESLKRPYEVPVLKGDYSKAKEKLGWEPKVKFHELVKIMVEHELHLHSN